MRIPIILLAALACPASIAAQDAAPSGFADLELARSRDCVGVLSRLTDLNVLLEPLGLRSERMRMLLQAIALEDRDVMDSLDQSDPTESAVHAWFIADGRLAQSIVDTGNQTLQQQRTISREQARATVQVQVTEIQTEAQALIDASGGLAADANPCDGAIFIRSAVLEACDTDQGPVCDAAADSATVPGFAFVNTPEDLWDVTELRPWTEPGGLQVNADGALIGARTVAFGRHGNVVLTVGFSPLIQPRASISEENASELDAILDSLGFEFNHPDLVYAPSLAVRATLPQPLAGEDSYVLHFGAAEEADILWTGPAGTGEVIEVPVVLDPTHVMRLQAGEPIRFTAVQTVEGTDNEALFTLELTTVNQVAATRALLGYMANQMVDDLMRLVPPRGG
ncbi:MAG TPA: hypothetical protein EYQ27_02400 [Gemmatimonadetes bacterium]|nr:hypothetical protein [Gemmatimonadota bacterium]